MKIKLLNFFEFIKFANLIELLLRKSLFFPFKKSKIFNLNFDIFNPIKYAGTMPTSDNTEYLPPI